jgi:hypothetical protein
MAHWIKRNFLAKLICLLAGDFCFMMWLLNYFEGWDMLMGISSSDYW